jgi:CTP synthase (UTP-ammonia lyase)
MHRNLRIGLIGDFDASIPAHIAIPRALSLASDAVGIPIIPQWLPTEKILTCDNLAPFDGLWCAPGSPYRNMDGALLAIRFARESRRPFLGTCGGFQHALLEYARNVLGWTNAEHAESCPDAPQLIIAPLKCSLRESSGVVRFLEGSHLRRAYGIDETVEQYNCRYGLNPAFRTTLLCGPLTVSAEDPEGNVRAVELQAHPFFVATLFQPERASLEERLSPIVLAFMRASL